MNRFLTLLFAALLGCQLTSACAADEVFPVAHQEPIAVRVADGNSGKPLVKQHVLLVAGYDRRDLDLALWREEAVTDGEGKVSLSNTMRNLPLLRVEVLKRHNCEPGADTAAFSVERIRLEGLSGVDRCGDLVAQSAPGVLTVFVKGRKGDVAGVVAPPLPPAAAASPTPAVSVPVPVFAASVPAKTEPSSQPEADHHTEPHDSDALPPIPFALPAEFFSTPAPDSAAELSLPAPPRIITHRHSAAKSALPAAAVAGESSPRAKAAPGGPTIKPASPATAHPSTALRHAVALERGRRRALGTDAAVASPDRRAAALRLEDPSASDRASSRRKPPAGHALAMEQTPGAADSMRAANGPQAYAASAPPRQSAPVQVQPLAPGARAVPSPAAVPSLTAPPDEGGVDPLCMPEGEQD